MGSNKFIFRLNHINSFIPFVMGWLKKIKKIEVIVRNYLR